MTRILHPINFPKEFARVFGFEIQDSDMNLAMEWAQDREVNLLSSILASLERQFANDGYGTQEIIAIYQAYIAKLFSYHQGAIIEVTPSLVTLLGHTDMVDIPANIFQPPFEFSYFDFSNETDLSAGVYVWQTQLPIDGESEADVDFFERMSGVRYDGSRYIKKIQFMVSSTKIKNGFGAFDTGFVIYENGSDNLMDIMEWNVFSTAKFFEKDLDLIRFYLNITLKTVLYMGCKDARVVENNERQGYVKRLSGLGRKKLARFLGRVDNKHDRIIVGPETLSGEELGAQGGGSKSTHWRRGHFRNQPHGPRNRDRHLVWIRPTIINNQPDISVNKKNYRVR